MGLEATALLPFVLLALLGSLHCAGMCGGFALAVASRRGSGAGPLALYVLGKALCYAALGVAVSLLAHAAHAGAGAGAVADGRRLVAWAAGIVIALAGLSAMGLVPRVVSSRAQAALAPLRPLWRGVSALPPASMGFGVGFLTGLLPCGLSWSALALASQTSPAEAALGLFAFGLATSPVLAAVGLAHRVAPPRVRRAGALLLGPALVVLGLLTLARGGAPWSSRVLPPCCEPESGDASGVGGSEQVRSALVDPSTGSHPT